MRDAYNYSQGSTIEQLVDLQEQKSIRENQQSSTNHSTTYRSSTTIYASQAGGTADVSEEEQIPSSSYPSYVPLDTTTGYWEQQDDPWSSQNLSSSTSTNSASESFYQPHDDNGYGAYPSYTAAAHNNVDFYSTPDALTGGWLPNAGDPSLFVNEGMIYDTGVPNEPPRQEADFSHFREQGRERPK